jgi:hypothetical protein
VVQMPKYDEFKEKKEDGTTIFKLEDERTYTL